MNAAIDRRRVANNADQGRSELNSGSFSLVSHKIPLSNL